MRDFVFTSKRWFLLALLVGAILIGSVLYVGIVDYAATSWQVTETTAISDQAQIVVARPLLFAPQNGQATLPLAVTRMAQDQALAFTLKARTSAEQGYSLQADGLTAAVTKTLDGETPSAIIAVTPILAPELAAGNACVNLLIAGSIGGESREVCTLVVGYGNDWWQWLWRLFDLAARWLPRRS